MSEPVEDAPPVVDTPSHVEGEEAEDAPSPAPAYAPAEVVDSAAGEAAEPAEGGDPWRQGGDDAPAAPAPAPEEGGDPAPDPATETGGDAPSESAAVSEEASAPVPAADEGRAAAATPAETEGGGDASADASEEEGGGGDEGESSGAAPLSGCPEGQEEPSYDDEVARMMEEKERQMEAKVEEAFAMFDNMPMGELFSTYRVLKKQETHKRKMGDGEGEAELALPQAGFGLPPSGFGAPAPAGDAADLLLPPPNSKFQTGLNASSASSQRAAALAGNDSAEQYGSVTFHAVKAGGDPLSNLLPGSSFADDTPNLSFSGSPAVSAPTELPTVNEDSTVEHGAEEKKCAVCGVESDGKVCDCPAQELKASGSPAGMHRDPSFDCFAAMSNNPFESSDGDNRGSSIHATSTGGGENVATWEYDEVTEDGGVALNFDALIDASNLNRLATVLEMQYGESFTGEAGGGNPDDDTADVLAKVQAAAMEMGLSLLPDAVLPEPDLVTGGAEVLQVEGGQQLAATGGSGAGLNALTAPDRKSRDKSSATPDLHSLLPSPPSALSNFVHDSAAAIGALIPGHQDTSTPAPRPTPPPPAPGTPPATPPRTGVSSPPTTGEGMGNKADMMKSKKEDLAAAIREQLKAQLANPLDDRTTNGTVWSKKTGTMGSAKNQTTGSDRPASLKSSLNKTPAGKPTPPTTPAIASTPEASSAEAAAQEILKASLKGGSKNATPKEEEGMVASIKVGFVEGKIKPLNIVMLITGTRGDVQPFIGIGLKLQEYGHRVRIASHKCYRPFVEGFGLEFYPLGGDPKVLSEYVVKHRGIMPGLDIKDALKQREQVRQILYSSWGACVEPDPENPHKHFIADAIVANPPAYGHSHCAEKLNCPLHIVFTMPWTPTKAFPSPFARIKTVIGANNSSARDVMNWLSYFAMEDLAWLGMAGMVKDFRQNVLGIKTWNKEHTSHALFHSKVPFTYIWSPSLVGRPRDWPSYCEVVGFINLEVNKLTKYKPPQDLADFLAAGPPPIYIGFGSLVVGNPARLTAQFMEALKATGLRAIIQKGWGGLGVGVKQVPKDVFMLEGNCAHDWLFTQCSAVVHHGGAGTTATGLYAGKPTFIVYFFGDQPFWGAACASAGVGPEPCSIDDLSTAKITDALKELILPTRQQAALRMQERMLQEDGISATVDHMHRTIYGALVGGKAHMWMRQNESHKKHVEPRTKVYENVDADGEGHLRGVLNLRSPESVGEDPKDKQVVTRELKPVPAVSSGGSLCSGFGKQPQVIDPNMPRKKGFFSMFGC